MSGDDSYGRDPAECGLMSAGFDLWINLYTQDIREYTGKLQKLVLWDPTDHYPLPF